MTFFSDDSFSDPTFIHLMEEYQKSIPKKLEELNRLIQDVCTSPTEKTLKPLQFALHKLAGNASAYGYNEVSKICLEFENKINQQTETGSQPDSKFLAQIKVYFQKIKDGFYDSPSQK